MTGREILHKMMKAVKEKVERGSYASADSGKGKSKIRKDITHGYLLVKGKAYHEMGGYSVGKFKEDGDNELKLFAIFNRPLRDS